MLQVRGRAGMRVLAAVLVSSATVLAVVLTAAPAFALSANQFPSIAINELIVMPDQSGHTAFIAGINGAKQSLDIAMYHLTDQQVINALIAKEQSSHIRIRMILDGKSLQDAQGKALLTSLRAAGIDARPSSPLFSIMHEKSMVVDDQYAFITSINLTNTALTSRDYGIITHDANIIAEMDSVFATDLDNATNQTGNTPALSNANLIWSPVNSEPKLVMMINDATQTLLVTVESLTDDSIIAALGQAAARGVQVFMLVPQCDSGDALLNYPAIATLQKSHVNVRVMPPPGTFAVPYMHAKTIIADGQLVYIGSVNYSFNSTQKARELGVIFYDANIGHQITLDFQQDWANGILPPAAPTVQMCQLMPDNNDGAPTTAPHSYNFGFSHP